jgi:uncharacterized protein (DUF885 family)
VNALPPPSGRDRVTWGSLRGEIESDLALRRCHLHEWSVDPRDGPQVLFLNLANLQPVTTPAQGRALVGRWQEDGPRPRRPHRNLRRGLAAGKVATRGSVERVLRQLDDLLAAPTAEWVLMAPARAAHPDWSDADHGALYNGVAQAIDQGIRPAFQRYRDVVRAEILPRARPDDAVGLAHVPRRRRLLRQPDQGAHLAVAAAEEIHRIGLEEVASVRAEMTALGQKLFGTGDLKAVQQRLRTDPALYFRTREEVEAKAEQALRRAEAVMPKWFGHLPRTPCVVKRVEGYEEKDTTIAYYRQPTVDGSRPGTYYINTYAPTTRPRYEAEVLAFHESVPGHHTQIALAMEMTGLPEFRKHLGPTSFVEGWALYTERLTDEMGLYSADLDRMGKLSFDAWRASRLVVDTGLHVKGWSRQQAIPTCSTTPRWPRTTSRTRSTATSAGPARPWPTRSASARSRSSATRPRQRWAPASTSAASTTASWPTAPSACPCCATRSSSGCRASRASPASPPSDERRTKRPSERVSSRFASGSQRRTERPRERVSGPRAVPQRLKCKPSKI